MPKVHNTPDYHPPGGLALHLLLLTKKEPSGLFFICSRSWTTLEPL